MKRQANKSISVFNQDAVQHQGYRYSTNAPLSSQIAKAKSGARPIEYQVQSAYNLPYAAKVLMWPS